MTQTFFSSISMSVADFFFASSGGAENQIVMIGCWILIVIYSLYLLFTIFYHETLGTVNFLQGLCSSDSTWNKSQPLWGKSILAINRKPQNVIIKIVDEDGNYIDSQITSKGNFGFKVEPGIYFLELESAKYSVNCIKYNGKILKSNSRIVVRDSEQEKIDVYLDTLNVNYDFSPKSINAFDNLIKGISSSIIMITIATFAIIFLSLLRGREIAGYQMLVLIFVLVGLYLDIRKKYTLNLVFSDRGRPVGEALVKVKDAFGKVTYLSTDKFGRARWRFARGKYRVEATKTGFSKVVTELYSLNRSTDKKRIALEFKKDLS